MGLALILAAIAGFGRAAASPPQAITLLYFEGQGLPGAALLRWATGTEYETAGFRLERGDSLNGTYEELEQIGFIPAEGNGLMGAEYEATDADNVVDGQAYWYVLFEIENDGSENTAGPIRVFAGPATATPTATASPTTASQPPASSSPTEVPPTDLPPGAPSTPTPLPTAGGAATAGATQPAGSTGGGSALGNGSTTGQTVPIGQVQDSTPPAGYPPAGQVATPAPPEAVQSPPAGYPPATATMAAPAQIGTVPGFPGGVQPAGTPIRSAEPTRPASSLGATGAGSEAAATGQSDPSPTAGTILLLWVGFILALVVFILSVIGSIILFTRQRMQAR
jgi:hypothetical protein